MADGGKLVIKIDGDDSGFKKASDSIKKASAALGTAVAAGMGAAVKVGMDFEAQMSRVGAISSASAEDMEVLTEKAKQMGETTVFSASQAGEAFEMMAMAGWKTEEMTAGIAGIMDLAAASGENLGTVSDIVTDALTAFGLSANDSGHFADVLAAASSNANTNVSMMGETFKYAAPLAGSLGYSIEDTAVAIGLMANAGIKSTQAGTALRSVLTRLAKPPKDAQKAMSALGLSLTDTNGKVKPLNQQMTEMRKAFSKLDDAQKPTYAAMLGGQEAMSGLLAIINASESDFEKLTGAVTNANGAASEMAERNLDNLKGKLTLAGSAAEGLGIAVYEGIEEPLKKAVEKGTEYLGKLTEKVKDPEFMGFVTNAAQYIGVAAGALIAYKTAATVAAAAQALINATITVNPFGMAAAAAVGLVFAVKKLNDAMRTQADAEAERVEGIKENVRQMKLAAEQTGSNVKAAKAETDRIKDLAQELRSLADEKGRVQDKDKGRVKYILGELNSALGTEYELVDNNISKWKDFAASIDEVIAKQQAQALLDSVQEDYNKANKNKSEYEQNLANASAKVGDLQTQLELLQSAQDAAKEAVATGESANSILAEYGVKTIGGLGAKIKSVKDNLAVATDEYDAAAVQWAENSKIIIKYEDLKAAVAEGDYEKIIQAIHDFSETLITANSLAEKSDSERTATLSAQLGEQANIYKGVCREVENGTQGFSEQMRKSYADTVADAVKEFVDGGGDLQAAVGIFNERGVELSDELISAIAQKLSDGGKDIQATTEQTIRAAVDAAKTKASSDSEGIGKNIAFGVATGIKQNANAANASMDAFSSVLVARLKKLLGIQSPSRKFRDEVGKMIPAGIAVGIDDGKTEVMKVLDELGKEMLEAEKFYVAESERIEREKEEAEYQQRLKDAKTAADREKVKQERIKSEAEKGQQKYLEGLKDAADRERKIYEALQKDIENEKQAIVDIFSEMAEQAADSIEELEAAQTEFASKLKNYGSLYHEYRLAGGDDEVITGTMLADISKQNEELQRYADNLKAIKQRGAIPQELLNQIRSMSVEEGLVYTDTLLNASDDTFDKYISDWQKKQELADTIAQETYGDEFQELADKLTEKYGKIPEDFFGIGKDSAERFGDGFMNQLKNSLEAVRREVIATMSTLSPALSFAGGGRVIDGVTVNGSYNTTSYNITATGGSEQGWIQSVRDFEQMRKMSGGY